MGMEFKRTERNSQVSETFLDLVELSRNQVLLRKYINPSLGHRRMVFK